jgi:inner membrane protein
MPSVFTHAIAASALAGAVRPSSRMPARFWVAVAVGAAFPDFDVAAFRLGIPYDSMWGHRGLSHSLAFPAIAAVCLVAWLFSGREGRPSTPALWFCLFIAIASHGLLDAMTDGGLGVAFFAPFSSERYFLPWRPILVSPIGVTRFFSPRGAAVLASELRWVWLPSMVVAAFSWWLRYRFRSS